MPLLADEEDKLLDFASLRLEPGVLSVPGHEARVAEETGVVVAIGELESGDLVPLALVALVGLQELFVVFDCPVYVFFRVVVLQFVPCFFERF